MTDEIRECYRLLELEPGASLEAVKAAYRELVKIWHPDRFPNDSKVQKRANEKTKALNEAYQKISAYLAGNYTESRSRTNARTAEEAAQRAREETEATRREAERLKREEQRRAQEQAKRQEEGERQQPPPASWRRRSLGPLVAGTVALLGTFGLVAWFASEGGKAKAPNRAPSDKITALDSEPVQQVPGNPPKAAATYTLDDIQALAEKGDADAQYKLGWLYYKGEGVAENSVQAYKWCSLAATQGVQKAKETLSSIEQSMSLLQIEVGQRLAREFRAPNRAPSDKITALDSEPVQQVPGNPPKAAATYTLDDIQALAEKGDADAQYKLGWLYYKGEGVAENSVQAYKWCSLAATQGVQKAKETLSSIEQSMSLLQIEVGQRLAREFRAPNRAPSDKVTALDSEPVQQVPGNPPKAAATYTLDDIQALAEKGDADAQYKLGWRYYKGEGVAENSVQAYKWCSLAATQGVQKAKETLSSIEQSMSLLQIEVGQRLAREFRASPASR